MTLSKKIIMSLIFWGASVCHAQTAQPKEAMPYKLEDGSRFQVCKDVTAYLNTYRAQLKSNPREVFTFKHDKFSKPKSTPSTAERYVQVALQELANRVKFKGIAAWKNRVNYIEGTLNEQLAVQELNIDINNDGIINKVISASYYAEEFNVWYFISFVLDDNGNLNLAFKKGRYALGELFSYDGRTYSYQIRGYDEILIKNHWPSYNPTRSTKPEDIDGLHQVWRPTCKILMPTDINTK